jgi:hypothetical protein
MNYPQNTYKTLALVCSLIAASILCWYILSGSFLFQAGQQVTIPATDNTSVEALSEIDADFTIAEVNTSVIHFIPLVHISDEDLKKYPEFEQSINRGTNSTEKWNVGTRMIALYGGNLSRYYSFVDSVCNGRPITECNYGVLFEYRGKNYSVSYQEYYGYHQTCCPTPEQVNSTQQVG